MTQTQEFQPVFQIADPTEHDGREIFDRVLSEAVDSALLALGSLGRQTFYRFLNENYGLAREDIPCKFEVFVKALEDLFGKAACLVEIQIMQMLHKNTPDFEFPSNADTFTFRRFVETFRAYL